MEEGALENNSIRERWCGLEGDSLLKGRQSLDGGKAGRGSRRGEGLLCAKESDLSVVTTDIDEGRRECTTF